MNQLTQQDIEVLEVLESQPEVCDVFDIKTVLGLPEMNIRESLIRLVSLAYVSDVWCYEITTLGRGFLFSMSDELDPFVLLYAGMGGAA